MNNVNVILTDLISIRNELQEDRKLNALAELNKLISKLVLSDEG